MRSDGLVGQLESALDPVESITEAVHAYGLLGDGPLQVADSRTKLTNVAAQLGDVAANGAQQRQHHIVGFLGHGATIGS